MKTAIVIMVINDEPSITEELLIFSLSGSGTILSLILVVKGILVEVDKDFRAEVLDLWNSVRVGIMCVVIVVV